MSTDTRSDSVVRVNMSHLDDLLNSTGEILITGGQIKLLKESLEEAALRGQAPDQKIITLARQVLQAQESNSGRLQKIVMEMRQVPIRDTLQRAKLTIRDLAKKTGKLVALETIGEDTLVDRAIVEKISDPLLHILRNAVDHGVESPEERADKGKPEKGAVILRVSRSAQLIVIDISDDGKGLDTHRLKEKAVERGILTESQAAGMAEEDAFSLIFHSGLSTAEKVTDLSGRGVGMDVVRRNIESLGGEIRLKSSLGQGSTFTIIFPNLSAVNIVEALLVRTADETFAIPLDKVEATLSIGAAEIHTLSGEPALRFRGHVIPLFELADLIGLKSGNEAGFTPPKGAGLLPVVVVAEKKEQIALVVDTLLTPRKIVSSGMDPMFSRIRGISGTTALGVGKLGMILDVPGILSFSKGEAAPEPVEAPGKSRAGKFADAGAPGESVAGLPRPAVKTAAESVKTELKVSLASDISQKDLFTLEPGFEGRLVDAVAKGETVYGLDIFVDKDLRNTDRQLTQMLRAAESVADVVAVSPVAANLPDLASFDPASFDIKVSLFLISRKSAAELAAAVGLPEARFKTIPVEVVEVRSEEKPKAASAKRAGGEKQELLPISEIQDELNASVVDLEDYILDMKDHLSAVNQCALAMADGEDPKESVERMFRAVHSMKGSSALMGLKRMADVAHKVEDVMDAVRNGVIEATEQSVDLVLSMTKMFEGALEEIKAGATPTLAEAENIRASAVRLLPAREEEALALESMELSPTSYDKMVMEEAKREGRRIFEVAVLFPEDSPMKMVIALLLFQSLKEIGDIITTAPSMAAIDKGRFDVEFRMVFATTDSAGLEKRLKEQELEKFEIQEWREG